MATNQSLITTEFKGKAMVLTLMAAELLEDAEIDAMEKAIMKKVEESSVSNVVLNFENVRFLSSAVLRVLVKVNAAVGRSRGKLRLCSIDPKILEVFKITRLDKVFSIQPDVEAAVDSVS
jgi:anti-sigma B factor antagonist